MTNHTHIRLHKHTRYPMNHRLTLRLQQEQQKTSKAKKKSVFLAERHASFFFPKLNSLDIGDFFFGLSFFMPARKREREQDERLVGKRYTGKQDRKI